MTSAPGLSRRHPCIAKSHRFESTDFASVMIDDVGCSPSRKVANVRNVKRYFQVAQIARDGLFVVKLEEPLSSAHECITGLRQTAQCPATQIEPFDMSSAQDCYESLSLCP